MQKAKAFLDFIVSILGLPGAIIAFLGIVSPFFTSFIAKDMNISIKISNFIFYIFLGFFIGWFLAKLFSNSILGFNGYLLKRNWKKFKEILTDYYYNQNLTTKQKEKLEKQYLNLRDYFLRVLTENQELVINHYNQQRPNATNYGTLAYANACSCFTPPLLATWRQHNNRRIPDEIQTFDRLFIFLSSLKK